MSSPLSPSLINLDESFPVEYMIEWDCAEENLIELVEKVATFTSQVYATFPIFDNEERKQLRETGVWIDEIEEHSVPSRRECARFEDTLKKEIIATLLNPKKINETTIANSSVKLSTDYFMEGLLDEIVKSTFDQKKHLSNLFPYKTYTIIDLNQTKTKLRLDMRFLGPKI